MAGKVFWTLAGEQQILNRAHFAFKTYLTYTRVKGGSREGSEGGRRSV